MTPDTKAEQALQEVEGLLMAELATTQAATKRSMIWGAVVLVLIAGYLGFANSQIKKIFDPEGIALAASGMAIGAVPNGAAALRTVVVDGAPDIARAASQAIIDMLPTYRQVMEDEMDPVIDEATGILAQTAVQHMIKAGKEAGPVGEQRALQAGADAVLARFDTLMQEAMDEPAENDGPTPRQTIDASLAHMVVVDRGLRRVVRGRGDPRERELLLTWINLIGQYSDSANTAATDAYKQGEQVPD
ncbi:MAG: hypothetical protein GXP62_02830 [Oligoflexia bacterium]|nr:hypothetical protein [Oligoflexia bacterium]